MKSIRWKIWTAIFGVTFVVIAAIWLCQTFLLENFYLNEKKENILSHTQEIAFLINNRTEGTNLSGSLKSIAAENNYCIQIYDISASNTINIAPEGMANILENQEVTDKLISEKFLKYPNKYYLEENLKTNLGGKFYVGATHQVNNNSRTEYILLIATTLAPVKEAVATIQKQLVILTAFLIVFATIVALVISHSLTVPILKISNAAKEIAKGNLNTYVSVKSRDETGQLANNFNVMVKEISKANTLQRELVANVSHDIRTPLTMIKGYAETIKDLTGDHKEKREEQLDIIIAETDRLNTLVNDMLDLSKLQAGQLSLTYSTFDLAVLIRDILKRYDLLVFQENFSFSLSAPASCEVYADQSKIQQVLYNIINNATNHTGADKKIFVSLEETADKAVVSIRDTGSGIEPEYLPLIWDRYYKPYKKNDRKGMGTGLGLSIVKAILTAHQLQFGVESTVGVGSTFWFEVKKASPDSTQL